MMRSLVCERHRHHGVDLLLHDAHAALEGVVQLGVAHQDGVFLLEHAVAHAGADAEAFALVGLGHQVAAFQNEQHAALRVDGLDGQIQDHREQFGQRPVFGQLLAGANQRLHGARTPWRRRVRWPWSGWRARPPGW